LRSDAAGADIRVKLLVWDRFTHILFLLLHSVTPRSADLA
jgi:hypothetical protein